MRNLILLRMGKFWLPIGSRPLEREEKEFARSPGFLRLVFIQIAEWSSRKLTTLPL